MRPNVLCAAILGKVMAGNQFWASSAADFSGALMSSDLLDCCHPLQNRETYSDRDIRHCCQVTALLIYGIRPWRTNLQPRWKWNRLSAHQSRYKQEQRTVRRNPQAPWNCPSSRHQSALATAWAPRRVRRTWVCESIINSTRQQRAHISCHCHFIIWTPRINDFLPYIFSPPSLSNDFLSYIFSPPSLILVLWAG
jgi:hypothetical protein